MAKLMASTGNRKIIAASLAAVLSVHGAPPAWSVVARVRVAVHPVASMPGVAIPIAIPSASNVFTPALSLNVPSGLINVKTPPLFPLSASSDFAQADAAQAQVRPNAFQTKSFRKRLPVLLNSAEADKKIISKSSGADAHAAGREGFARLLGLRLIRSGKSSEPVAASASSLGSLRARLSAHSAGEHASPAAAPGETPPPGQSEKAATRKYLVGTGIFKMGMEALSLSAPLLALTIFGQVKVAAVLVVGWGLSQIVFSSLSGGLLDRRSPSKVLAWSMAFQAATVAVLIGLFAADKFFPGIAGFPLVNPMTLLALYSLAGGFMGVSDTARQVIPPEIAGSQEHGLKIFNAKTHIAYEIAGVLGAVLTGVIIANFGIMPALLIHPPAYLLAAWVFSRLKITPRTRFHPEAAEGAPSEDRLPRFFGKGNPLARAYRDIIAGAKTVLANPVFRWSTLALIVPLVTHRLLEGLLIPVTAKTLLADPSAAAWIIGASNFGELLGAVLLMRALLSTDGSKKRFRSSFWVRLMTLGSLGIIGLTFADTIPFWTVLLLIGFRSMTWATSELSLRSKLQNGLPKQIRGRAFAFIGAVAFGLILAASMGVGFLMDILPRLTVFYGIDVVLVALAAMLFFSAFRLNGPKTPPNPS
jgi:hypothetical protein